jgi:15-cis-phytoene synthase
VSDAFNSAMKKFKNTTYRISKLVTKQYSTSFFSASKLFDREIRSHIFNIYGFVRFADEIVDTFHAYDKEKLLTKFEDDLYEALESAISLNPILHAFQDTANTFNIPHDYMRAFLKSMRFDLNKTHYINRQEFESYIYGSAEVVGLMCLKIFCNEKEALFDELKFSAVKLGSAFQKVNFLRDLKNDIENLGRSYFPESADKPFDDDIKKSIVQDIEKDFETAAEGIKKLPKNSKLAVYTAFLYYTALLKKIKKTKADIIVSKRIRVSDFRKVFLMVEAYTKYKLKLI